MLIGDLQKELDQRKEDDQGFRSISSYNEILELEEEEQKNLDDRKNQRNQSFQFKRFAV